MKVRLHLCVKGLPNPASVFASVSMDGNIDLGQTEVVRGSSNPEWEKEFVFDVGEQQRDITVQVVRLIEIKEEILGTASFDIIKIAKKEPNVDGVKLSGGGILYAHAKEYPVAGTLDFQISCEKLERRKKRHLGFPKSISDCFFVLEGATGYPAYTSDCMSQDVGLVWPVASVNLGLICSTNFDETIKFTFHERRKDGENDFIGEFETSINDLCKKLIDGEQHAVTKKDLGKVWVVGSAVLIKAEVSNYVHPREVARAAFAVTYAKELRSKARQKDHEASCQLQKARAAEISFARREQKALDHAELLLQSGVDANKALQEALDVKKPVASGETIVGKLKLGLRGKDLANVELFSIIDKSDPFFILKRPHKVDGKVQWEVGYTSEVIDNDLNPSWEVAEIELSRICNSLSDIVRIVVNDHNKFGDNELIGYFDASVEILLKAAASGDPFLIKKNDTNMGEVLVSEAELSDYAHIGELISSAKGKAEEAESFAAGRQAAARLASREAAKKRDSMHRHAFAAELAMKEAENLRELAEQSLGNLNPCLQVVNVGEPLCFYD